MEHFSRAVTDYAFIAELWSKATNCDALSLRICMYVRTYVCMYIWISIPLIPRVRRCHARQLGSTLHHHWPRICLLYHFIAVCCIQLCLVLKRMLNDCGCVRHFGCGHSHHVVRAPSPVPRECEWELCSVWCQLHCTYTLRKRQWSYSAYCSTGVCQEWY